SARPRRIWPIFRDGLGRPRSSMEQIRTMTDLIGLHSYFWLTAIPSKESPEEDTTYTAEAIKEDLLRVRNAWDECQTKRERSAIYEYLDAVFQLVAWWTAEGQAINRARKALRVTHLRLFDSEDPFAAIIRCTSDPAKVDKRGRSKWSRALRYAWEYK